VLRAASGVSLPDEGEAHQRPLRHTLGFTGSNSTREDVEEAWEEEEDQRGGRPKCPEYGRGYLADFTGDQRAEYMRFSCVHLFTGPRWELSRGPWFDRRHQAGSLTRSAAGPGPHG
jgi:hypothetical protein